jgi:hypothetical protein
VVSVAALAAVAVLGFGAAYVVAGSGVGTPGTGAVEICHSGSGKQFQHIAPDASGVLSGHADHPFDIIPPFVYVVNGTTTTYPGKNMDALHGAGYTGAEVLANGCRIPVGRVIVTTVPEAIILPGPMITSPVVTTVETVTEKIVVPARTATAPGTTTVVTVPPGETTTVSLPERIVPLPAATETINGEHVVRPAETVTLPETTTTETGGAKTAVVTVTGPDTVVEGGEHATREVEVTVTIPGRTLPEPAHTVPAHQHHIKGETATETVVVTRTEPATTVTLSGTTTTETRIEHVAVPAETVAVSPTTTVVTVSARETTTVALPPRRVTVPRSTETVNRVSVFRPPEVVTIPGVTRILTGGSTRTVETVTGPNKVVEPGADVTESALVAFTTRGRVVRVPAHVVRAVETKLIAIVVHAVPCPAGMALYQGTCTHIVRGSG